MLSQGQTTVWRSQFFLPPCRGPRAWTQVVSAFTHYAIIPSAIWGNCSKPHFFFILEGKICHWQLGIFLRIHNAQTWWLAQVRLWILESENGLQRLCYHQPTQKFLCWCIFSGPGLMSSSLTAPLLHISNPWHSPPWRLTGFLGCSEWVLYFSSSTVETKITLKWNFQKIATYLLSLWGGEFHSVWIIGALTMSV